MDREDDEPLSRIDKENKVEKRNVIRIVNVLQGGVPAVQVQAPCVEANIQILGKVKIELHLPVGIDENSYDNLEVRKENTNGYKVREDVNV